MPPDGRPLPDQVSQRLTLQGEAAHLGRVAMSTSLALRVRPGGGRDARGPTEAGGSASTLTAFATGWSTCPRMVGLCLTRSARGWPSRERRHTWGAWRWVHRLHSASGRRPVLRRSRTGTWSSRLIPIAKQEYTCAPDGRAVPDRVSQRLTLQ